MKITTLKTKLSDVDKIIFESEEKYDITQYEVMMDEEDPSCGLIDVYGIRTVIDSLGLSVREGTFYNYNEEDDAYDADFSVTLIYEKDEKDPVKYLYWEQDGIQVTLYNFLRQRGDDINGLSDLEDNDCVIEFEEDEE